MGGARERNMSNDHKTKQFDTFFFFVLFSRLQLAGLVTAKFSGI